MVTLKFSSMLSLPLLSTRFKVLGFTIAAIGLLLRFYAASELSQLIPVSDSLTLAGLILAALAKDKIEDELKTNLRFKALAIACLLQCLIVIFAPLSELIFPNIFPELRSSIMVNIGFSYHVFFYLLKNFF